MTVRKTVSFSKNATNIFFHILTACNLRCRHCYINPEQHGHKTLPIETIKQWLDAFSGKSSQANVIFLGGEPTLHPELAPAIKYARKLGVQSVTIDTNGYLFHNILEKVTPDEVDYISFSLDGATRETNDRLRGEGVYDTCMANIPKAVQKGFKTSLIYTVSSANLDELAKMPPLLAELGVEHFFIQVIGLRGNSVNEESTRQVSREQWLRHVPQVAQIVAETGITVTYPKVFLGPEDAFECAGLCADNYFIFPNGRVYRCPLCEDFPLHGMEFKDDQLKDRPKLTETELFHLTIPEGCVMNKLIQPDNLSYGDDGLPEYRVACCMLKEEVTNEDIR